MAKYSEDTLTSWTKPPSETEQTKLENSERMVREAINDDPKLKTKSTETFGQGSYANDTNVKLNSDIDINVRYTGGFYFELPENTTETDIGLDKLGSAAYTFKEFKDDVENALVRKFGRSEVVRNDKCITIKENTYRIQTDVVPTWNYRRYNKNGTFVLGAKFFPDNSAWGIVNFPKQHIQNAINKNSNTSRRFKLLTRLHRKVRYKMIDDGIKVSDNITSFLLECLVWNTPNRIMNEYDSWTERLKQSIIYIYQQTTEDSTCKEWGEVSELLYLFYSGRKWSRSDVNEYMVQLWNYLEF
ncbi:nucleotidyltransferase [Chryseobacterium sp. KBW03]|uniref:nucleotidyltransferase domain-containing protein n=1 Tax=Chryseobacterium sp. KBW03 TaxID=2153362 RepID=UPI000F59EBAA|nr:nucleotidyltransferase [Chryseobacterium sp. KBW03]RQO40167.1 nucleotidyltransferase [Chryseobacterium sp. KBW03]